MTTLPTWSVVVLMCTGPAALFCGWLLGAVQMRAYLRRKYEEART